MSELQKPRWRINDGRGRSVVPMDPLAMHLLHRHEIIEADVLRAIVGEEGISITVKERASLIVGVSMLVAVGGLAIYEILVGGFLNGPFARTSSLVYFALVPWFMWLMIRRARANKIASAMLKYLRCPHCGYDLRMLPRDSTDGLTVCPECGCAWGLHDETAK